MNKKSRWITTARSGVIADHASRLFRPATLHHLFLFPPLSASLSSVPTSRISFTSLYVRPDGYTRQRRRNTARSRARVIDMYSRASDLDVGTWGRSWASAMGLRSDAAIEPGKPVLASGTRLRVIRHGGRDHSAATPAGCCRLFNTTAFRGTDVNPTGGSDVATTVFVKDSRTTRCEAFGGVGMNANEVGRAQTSRERGYGIRNTVR